MELLAVENFRVFITQILATVERYLDNRNSWPTFWHRKFCLRRLILVTNIGDGRENLHAFRHDRLDWRLLRRNSLENCVVSYSIKYFLVFFSLISFIKFIINVCLKLFFSRIPPWKRWFADLQLKRYTSLWHVKIDHLTNTQTNSWLLTELDEIYLRLRSVRLAHLKNFEAITLWTISFFLFSHLFFFESVVPRPL